LLARLIEVFGTKIAGPHHEDLITHISVSVVPGWIEFTNVKSITPT
jgi:hypothetical protein